MFFVYMGLFVLAVLFLYGLMLYYTSPAHNKEAAPDWSADTGFIDWRNRK